MPAHGANARGVRGDPLPSGEGRGRVAHVLLGGESG